MLYKRFENTTGVENSWRYTIDNKITNSSRVPEEVKEKLEYAPSVEHNFDQNNACIFCDTTVSRTRMVNLETIGLCEWHYQHMNLGKIVQQVRENKLRKEKQDVHDAKSQTSRKRKLKRRTSQDPVAQH